MPTDLTTQLHQRAVTERLNDNNTTADLLEAAAQALGRPDDDACPHDPDGQHHTGCGCDHTNPDDPEPRGTVRLVWLLPCAVTIDLDTEEVTDVWVTMAPTDHEPHQADTSNPTDLADARRIAANEPWPTWDYE